MSAPDMREAARAVLQKWRQGRHLADAMMDLEAAFHRTPEPVTVEGLLEAVAEAGKDEEVVILVRQGQLVAVPGALNGQRYRVDRIGHEAGPGYDRITILASASEAPAAGDRKWFVEYEIPPTRGIGTCEVTARDEEEACRLLQWMFPNRKALKARPA